MKNHSPGDDMIAAAPDLLRERDELKALVERLEEDLETLVLYFKIQKRLPGESPSEAVERVLAADYTEMGKRDRRIAELEAEVERLNAQSELRNADLGAPQGPSRAQVGGEGWPMAMAMTRKEADSYFRALALLERDALRAKEGL